MLVCKIREFRKIITDLATNSQFEKLRPKVWAENIQEDLETMIMLTKTHVFLTGSFVTYADFLLYELLNYIKGIWP